MTATVSKAGPYYTSGEIKFSSLRSNFRAQVRKTTSGGSETFKTDSDPIKASELLRNTATTDKSPKVPDATENANISTSSNWKLSQFRNSIKYYYIAQSGTDENFDIDAQSWNSNLNKTVQKFLFIDGTCGSNDATLPAAQLSATAYNLTVDVYGSILGASGKGGGTAGAPAISGQGGGDALEMTSTSGANNIVLVRDGSKIYGGGGGGEKGKTGDNGSAGNCYDSFRNNGDCNCPGCPSGWTDNGCSQNYGSHCGRRMAYGCWNDQWWESSGDSYGNNCYKNYEVTGGTGGVGGNGGPGRGYNNQTGSLNGADGADGTSGQSCYDGGSYTITPSDGVKGEPGGSGGEWGSSGENRDDTGTGYVSNTGNTGGSAGKAVFGSNFTVTGKINQFTVKGAYK